MNTPAVVCFGASEKQRTNTFDRAVMSGHERKELGEQGGRSKLVELGCRQKPGLYGQVGDSTSGDRDGLSLGVGTGDHDVNIPSTEVKGKTGI